MDGAYNGALNLIEANPDMDIIYSGDAFAEGVANAVNDMGLIDSIDVVGGDRADSLLQDIKDGNVMGTIAQDTFAEGFFGVLYMYVARQGLVSQEGGRLALPDTSITQSFTITAETVDFFLGVEPDKPSLPAGTDGSYYMIGGNLGHPWWKQHFRRHSSRRRLAGHQCRNRRPAAHRWHRPGADQAARRNRRQGRYQGHHDDRL